MLALVLVLLSQVQPDSRVTRVERVPGGRMEGGRGGVMSYAFFEAFPASGAGTTTACSTTPPTGAKGETLTFARTGNATCTRTASGGLATTGIANGDLVVMSANVPRVEYDSNGVKGLLVESARTNSCLRSEEFDNAAWSVSAFPPTRTANYATAPDGTTTADRIEFVATGVGQSGPIFQAAAAPLGSASCSVYARMTSGTGSLPHFINLGAGLYACATCAITDQSWTRCVVSGTTTATRNYGIGNESTAGVCFGALPALDVLLWGASCEAGSYATSYIPTTSAAVTRNEDVAYCPITLSGPILSLGVTAQAPYATPDASRLLVRADNGGATAFSTNLYATATGAYVATQATGSIEQTTVAVGAWTTPRRVCNTRDGTTAPQYWVDTGFNSYTRVEGLGPIHTRLYFGNYSSAGVLTPANAILTRIKADPVSGKCP